ncbi:hypothetical protein PGB90_001596 [Kerria lacca]
MEIDTEKLISEIEEKPELWNLNSKDYKDRNKKKIAWATVARNTFPEYEKKETDSEKEAVGKEINIKSISGSR